MSENQDNYYDENLNYYQRNKERLRKYNRDYYKFRQETDPLYIKKKTQNYVTGPKMTCPNCGTIVRTRYINTHQKTKSCKFPLQVPLKKRNLLNLRNTIDSDDEEYFKL